jgi:hypothetical protein
MPNPYSPLWGDDDQPFWPSLELTILDQSDYGHGTCVPTSLAIVASALHGDEVHPDRFMTGNLAVNTQSPQDWSDKLGEFGAQLAYCNFDARHLDKFIPELIEYDDLFVIGFYSGEVTRDAEIGATSGSSHMITMYKDLIYDTGREGSVQDARTYDRGDCMVKRIFRVVPAKHHRKV